MLNMPRWKAVWTLIVLGVGVLLALPSLMPESTARAIGLGRAPRINLGLDLSGGSRLLLEADTTDVGRQRLATMEETVRAEMRRANPRIEIGDISATDGRLSFFVRDVTRVDAAVELIRKLTQGVGITGQRDWDVRVVDGQRIEMAPTPDGVAQAVDQAMEVATEVVRKRIDELGTREPSIVRQGSTRIDVQVPGLQNPEALKALLGKTAKLEFKLVDLAADPALVARGRAPAGSQALPYLEQPGQFIAVQRRAIITGDQLTKAEQSYDENGRPVIAISFNSQGGARFAAVTRDNVGKPFAMILDNQVLSAPTIQTPILNGSAQISGNYTVESANAMAIQLRSGALPVALKVIEERTVGPQLGADSIRAGVLASVIAVAAVIAFMVLTYGRFGIYATIAVTLNLFVIVGVLALLNGTLTLPGIAGFVLTIGTAVDANVLINERIREERRRGRSIIASVEHGYKEASRTIFEANVTHAIAGVIMLVLGSGPVKGFAVVLLIGIATSVFTAVTFTRLLVASWLKRKRPTEIHI
ncbi:protein translocase subunit SecD [Sphingomonas jatrophae]|uniref:Protein translocase subunit SecD n=1 Tax=Sphingomonas jatrophae TaxID=1166337 RepID=A0A1I6M985_9SPHN|nr:protein translocase subunit SecD [Sphingomonas jatrophae]SFS12207.1 preprotein translocase subunit SecD [Sphingomonas jatrophae]